MKKHSIKSYSTRTALVLLAATICHYKALAFVPAHNIAAGTVIVIQNDTGNNNSSVTTSIGISVNGFRVRTAANSRGDFGIQIGDDATDDATNGVVMASVTQNGRDNSEPLRSGTNQAVGFMAPAAAGYLLCSQVLTNDGGGSDPEWNVNMAGAYFPFTNWLGGYAFNLAGGNGAATITNDTLIGSPQLVYGTHFIDKGSGGGVNAGKSIVNLTSLGYDSRFDGVLLVSGAKNESANYALSRPNITNGTWDVFLRDAGGPAGVGEQDPVGFVFIPKTNTTVISGRFLGNATVAMYSGASPGFTVTNVGTGRYLLTFAGHGATNGVLIVSPDGGTTNNYNTVVNYEALPTGDGYEIQTLKCTNGVLRQIAAADGVASFVYIPIATTGITVTPTNNLQTSENGGTANFNVSLDTPPTDTVTIPVSSSNTGEGTVSTNSLTFDGSNWNIPQTVTITGVDDAVVDGSVAYTIILGAATSTDPNYSGLDPSDVSVINTDNDGGITVSPTSGLVTTESGGTATFNVHLNVAPTATVTIPISSSNPAEGTASPSSLIFDNTNWNIDQAVTVTGRDDFVDDGDIAYTIITGVASSADAAFNGLNPADVSVVNLDNDTSGLIVSAAGPLGLNVVEGRTNGYTVKLSTQPAANVTVSVVSGNTSQGGTVSPASLTFTPGNWSNAQPVTATGIDDLVLDGSISWVITNSVSSSDPLYAALPPVPVLMTTLDNEFTLTLPSGLTVWGIGQAAVGVDGRATLNDPNTLSYSGGSLTVTLTANGTATDRLEVRNSGTDPGKIGVSGTNVTYGGTTIGGFAGGVGTTPLTFSFNSSATPTAVEALARSVTFRSVTNRPSLNNRTVMMALSHADGYTSSGSVAIRVGLLRVTDFQEGADRGWGVYTGENDCHLSEAAPNSAFPSGNANGLLFIDWPDPPPAAPNSIHVLLRFDSLFGTNIWQIPPDAEIVSADLVLQINDSGEGSPLFRMLETWDATNATWSSMIGGIQQDDSESRSVADSQIQVGDGANTGIGSVPTSVLPDVLAWQTGAENDGWVMPGWPGRTDGTGFVPSEGVNISERPRLHVQWVPAGTPVASFRQNVNGYTGTADTRIRQNAPDTSFATVTSAFVDWAVTGSTPENDEQVLLRFDNIAGSATNQIPPGSQVHVAMLDLASTVGAAPGHGGNFYAMLTPWQDTDTWNTLVNGVTADGIEAAATPSATAGNASLNPLVVGGYHSFEMTTDVQAWVSGARPNYGWVGLPWPNGADGWGIGMSENGTESNRPQLRVFYTPSLYIRSITVGPGNVTIVFTGTVGNTCTVLRSATVNGTYTSIGSATVQPDGSATFTDNSPLPSAAFYRISYP